jgi:hypothetical protein
VHRSRSLLRRASLNSPAQEAYGYYHHKQTDRQNRVKPTGPGNRGGLLDCCGGRLLNGGAVALGFAEGDAALHLRVYLADVPERSGLYCAAIGRWSWETLREGVGKGLPRVQRPGDECSGRASCEYSVLGGALVDPPNRGSRLDDELGRLEVEIADRDRCYFLALRTGIRRDHQQGNGHKGGQARQ